MRVIELLILIDAFTLKQSVFRWELLERKAEGVRKDLNDQNFDISTKTTAFASTV